jgi:hypothetical protein
MAVNLQKVGTKSCKHCCNSIKVHKFIEYVLDFIEFVSTFIDFLLTFKEFDDFYRAYVFFVLTFIKFTINVNFSMPTSDFS